MAVTTRDRTVWNLHLSHVCMKEWIRQGSPVACVYEGVNTTWFTCRKCVWKSEYNMVHLSHVCMKEWIRQGCNCYFIQWHLDAYCFPAYILPKHYYMCMLQYHLFSWYSSWFSSTNVFQWFLKFHYSKM